MAAKRTKAVKPPTRYKTIAAACAGMTLGKLRGPKVAVYHTSEGNRIRVNDILGHLRLDLPLREAVMQLFRARGFRRFALESL